MRTPVCSAVLSALLCALAPASVADAASLLPIRSEDARALPHGHAEAVLGIDYFKDLRFPDFTPAGSISSQDLVSLPRIGLNFGLGDWAEVQASFEMLYLDEELAGGNSDTKYGSGDARLFTKLYLLAEHDLWPAAGVRFGTKLPNANVDDRLGTDEIDFMIDALASKDLGIASLHLNLGLALLDNPGPTAPTAQPFDSDGQDDLFIWSVAAASRPFDAAGGISLRLLAEFAGREGSRFDNDRDVFRGGLQLGYGAWHFYAGASAGLITASENVGATMGVIYDFQPGMWFGNDSGASSLVTGP